MKLQRPNSFLATSYEVSKAGESARDQLRASFHKSYRERSPHLAWRSNPHLTHRPGDVLSLQLSTAQSPATDMLPVPPALSASYKQTPHPVHLHQRVPTGWFCAPIRQL